MVTVLRSRQVDIRHLVLTASGAVLLGAAASIEGPALAAGVLAVVALGLLMQRTGQLAALLAVVALPFMRPNVLGERFAREALVLLVVAAFLAVVEDRGRLDVVRRRWTPLRSVCTWVAAGYVWILLSYSFSLGAGRGGGSGTGNSVHLVEQGAALAVGGCAALAVVCASPRRARFVARGFVALVAALSCSYMMTVLLWTVMGIGAGHVGGVRAASGDYAVALYAPFTPSVGLQTVLGVQLPRLTGLGREPGWMAMYCQAAFFLAPLVGWRSRRLRCVLVVGVLGCISTAGFGVFMLVGAYELLLRVRRGDSLAVVYSRVVIGSTVLVGAAWVALDAPVLGLNAKGDQNAQSLQDRAQATRAGMQALLHHPLGGGATQTNGAINLVAAVAALGLPFVLTVLAALVAPRRTSLHPGRTDAVVLTVLLTLLTSQPALDSVWAFGLILVTYAVAQGVPLRLRRRGTSRHRPPGPDPAAARRDVPLIPPPGSHDTVEPEPRPGRAELPRGA